MHTIGLSCSVASTSTLVAKTSKRQSKEGTSGAVMPSIISPSDFTKNIFSFSLRSLLETIEGGQFAQAQSMRAMPDYTLMLAD